MSKFFTFLLWSASIARKIYSPIIYQIIKVLFLKRMYKQEIINNPNLFSKIYDFEQMFEKEIAKIKWIQEPFYGLLDFTYSDYRYFLSESITKRFGRDCDDFSHWWFEHYKNDSLRCYQILLTVPGFNLNLFKKSHFITIVEDLNIWYICDNNRKNNFIKVSRNVKCRRRYGLL